MSGRKKKWESKASQDDFPCSSSTATTQKHNPLSRYIPFVSRVIRRLCNNLSLRRVHSFFPYHTHCSPPNIVCISLKFKIKKEQQVKQVLNKKGKVHTPVWVCFVLSQPSIPQVVACCIYWDDESSSPSLVPPSTSGWSAREKSDRSNKPKSEAIPPSLTAVLTRPSIDKATGGGGWQM